MIEKKKDGLSGKRSLEHYKDKGGQKKQKRTYKLKCKTDYFVSLNDDMAQRQIKKRKTPCSGLPQA